MVIISPDYFFIGRLMCFLQPVCLVLAAAPNIRLLKILLERIRPHRLQRSHVRFAAVRRRWPRTFFVLISRVLLKATSWKGWLYCGRIPIYTCKYFKNTRVTLPQNIQILVFSTFSTICAHTNG